MLVKFLTGTSLTSRSPEPTCNTAQSSTLAAALLDSHHRFNSNVADGRLRGTMFIYLCSYLTCTYLFWRSLRII